MPGTIYHYTTMSALFSIFQNIKHLKSNVPPTYQIILRATHCLYLNDPVEYRFYINIIKEETRKVLLKKKYSPVSIENTVNQYWKHVDNQFGQPYILSFSELSDDLSMWRSYGGNGQGVALGFSLEKLKELKIYSIEKCKYYTTDETVKNVIKKNIAKELLNIGGKKNILSLFELMYEASSTKHIAYKSEREWRLVAFKEVKDPGFFERDGFIIPFHDIFIPLDCLTSITIGPSCEKELSQFSLKAFLESKVKDSKVLEGIKVNISDIPYVVR